MTPSTDFRETARNLRAQAAAYDLRATRGDEAWEAVANHLYRAAHEADRAAIHAEECAGIRLPLHRVVIISEGAAP